MRRFFSLMFATAIVTVFPRTALQAQIVDYAALGDAFGEPITTSVTGKPQRASAAPASITIITRDQIARSPARSVPDLLKSCAGIDVNRWTAGQSDVAVRGGVQTYNARLLVLVDGRQVYLDHYGMTNWNLLGVQLDEIQQIELVRGPASALFGFNAASGVVNIITKSANAGTQASATGEIGTHGYTRFGGTVTVPITGAVGLKIAGGHQRENERAIPAPLYQPPVIHDIYADQISATFAIQAAPSTAIEINGGLTDNRQLEFLPSQILTEQRFRNRTMGLRVSHDTDWGSLDGRAYTNRLDFNYGRTTPMDDPYRSIAALHGRNRITVLEGSALVRLGADNLVRIGTEYRDNQLTSARLFSPRIGYRVAAVSTMLDLHPVDRVAVTGAVRLDHLWLNQSGAPVTVQIDPVSAYDRSISPISFNAAATVQVGESGHFRLNGGRGYQLPSLIGLGLRVIVPAPEVPVPVFLTGDPDLAPVAVWSGEASYAHGFHSGLQLNATLFYTRTDRLIASPGGSIDLKILYVPEPVAVTRFANVGRFSSYGIELAASGRITPALTWSANYSWSHVDEDIPANRDDTFYAVFPRAATPRHRGNLGLAYADPVWFANGLAHFVARSDQSSFLPTTELIHVRVPASVDLDAKIGRTLTPNLSLYVAGENLANGRGVYGSPIPADRRVRMGVSVRL